LNLLEILETLDKLDVHYREVKWQVENSKIFTGPQTTDHQWLMRLYYLEKDVETQKIEVQRGRWWVLDEPVTEDKIIKTAFAALEMSDGHVRRENFYYDGRRVFDPHISIATYKELADARS